MSRLLLHRLRREAGVQGPGESDNNVPAMPSQTPQEEQAPEYPEGHDPNYYWHFEYYDDWEGETTAKPEETDNAIKKVFEQVGDKMKGNRILEYRIFKYRPFEYFVRSFID